jgi:DNA polymerase I
MPGTKKLFLLDAYALIFRAYYAFINRPIRNSKGFNTSAIFGFVNSLDEVIRKEKPGFIAVAFDPSGPTFRHDMYEPYKANRQATPSDIKLSVPIIKQILEAYNIPILEYEGFEADDVIGTVSKIARKKGYEVYMMTPDKDYAQLVEPGLFIYKPRRSGNEMEILGVEEIKKNFGIENPEQVIDILALAGDSSDNIPGAPGIGEITAQKLIEKYGTVENLLKNTIDLKGKQKENIEKNADQILLSKKLATIAVNVPINLNIDELILKQPNKERLKAIFNELEFKTLLQRIIGENVSRVTTSQTTLFDIQVEKEEISTSIDFEQFNIDKVNYQLIDSETDINRLIINLKEVKVICFDTETTGLNSMDDEIVGMAISIKEKEAWYITFSDDQELTKSTLSKFKYILENNNIIKVGHNLKFDIQILRKYDIWVSEPYFDTMVAHYLLHPEGRHKLDRLTESMLSYQMIPIEELIGKKGAEQKNMRDIDRMKQKDYACEDADLTFRLFNKLKSQLHENNLDTLAKNIEMPLISVLTEMELAGFNIDIDALKIFETELNLQIEHIEKEIYNLAGEKFNIASPKQLGVVLFEKLKISENSRLTKTKQYSTNEEVLQKLEDSHPIINQILNYRGLTKLQSTYVTTLPRLLNKKTKKLHTSFLQTIAATGRLSSVNPNLQNIPIRDENGREIRKAFIPSSNEFVLISADYSQIELRLMAHMSGDENMLEAFKNNEDIHRSTAARIYKIKVDEVSREMRSKAKTANFGIIYGISAYGLSQRLRIPRSEALDLIENYFLSFPKVKEYMIRSISEAKSKGYVETLYGRKRYLPDIHSSNSVVRGVAERNAINSPIQGTAADIIKIAMINLHKKLSVYHKTKMILQVHDELVFDVFRPEAEEIKLIVRYEMENAAHLDLPLEVEIGMGDNWLEAH